MDPSVQKIDTKLPKGSEAKEITKTNKSINNLLESLYILEKNNPEHPSINERKKISKDTQEELNKEKEILDPSIKILDELPNIYDKLQKETTNKELKNKATELENKYYELTGFPVPFNRNNEMYVPID